MGAAQITLIYDAAGTYTWVAPAGITSVKVECYGGGGSTTAYGAGGGGEYAAETANTVVPGDSYTVVVGAAASSSTFSGPSATTVTAHGGSSSSTNTGGAGGTGSANTTHFNGGAGGNGSSSNANGGGGGGSGSASGAGSAGTSVSLTTDVGTGGAGAGGGGGGVNQNAHGAGNGGNGSVGGGGGGGSAASGGTAGTGGTGPAGNGVNGGVYIASSPAGNGGGQGGGLANGGPGGGGSVGGGCGGGSIGATGGAGGVAITYSVTSPLTVTAPALLQFTVPGGVSSLNVQAWGGGGGSAEGLGTNFESSGGGGGGEYAAESSVAVTAGNTYAVIVGAGGLGSGGTPGGAGANTVFPGDSVTVTAHGGGGGILNGAGGAAGTGSSNTTHNNGGAGGAGESVTPWRGGGGGSSGGSAGVGNAGASGASGGTGGSAVADGGAGGNGATTGAGGTGTAPGGGAGGTGGVTSANGANGSSGQVILSWVSSVDIPVYLPGPTWLATFKPFIPRPRPIAPPSGPYFGNLPNPADVRSIQPGPTWLGSFKRGIPKPRPSLPHANVISSTANMAMAPMTMNAAATETPGAFGSAGMAPMAMNGTMQVPIVIQSASMAMAPMATSGSVHVPVVIQSASMAMTPMAIVTPSFLRDLPAIQAGPTWLNRFKPAWPKTLKIVASRQHIGATGNMAMAPMGYSGAQAVQYLPFPQFSLNLLFEILINGTWVNVTSKVYARNNIVITRGLPDETQSATPSQMTLTLDNRDGRFSPNNPGGLYYPYLTRNVQMRCSIVNQASASGVAYSGYRFWGEVSSWPPRWDPTGKDVYCDITVSGVLRRFVQGAPIGSTLLQYYTALSGDFAPYAYWPCEDGSKATEIASALPAVSAATFTGAPQFSSDSSFGGSDPLPVITSSVWTGQTGAASNPPGSGTIKNLSPGTYRWTAPPGVTAITGVVIIGGGGGGGDTDGTTGGSGGGGGGSRVSASSPVTPGTAYMYTVGAGGAAGSGGTGAAGTNSSFPADGGALTGLGGAGGGYAGASGGTGGAGGSFTGGSGGRGSASSTSSFYQTLTASNGATGGGTNVRAAQNQANWVAPTGVTAVNVTAVSGGGGGGAGGATAGGGQGGGGGSYASGNIDVTPGNSYTFSAGNGGAGGSGGPASGTAGPANSHGNPGGNSGASGDSSSVLAGGGGGGKTGGGDGQPGAVISGSGYHGGGGGGGTSSAFGGGGSGGGGASQFGGIGASGTPASGSHGGTNGVGGDGGTYPSPNNGKTGQANGAGGGGGASNSTLTGTRGGNGGGGYGGYVTWSWSQTGVPSAGGGGSSAGSSAGGSNGSGGGTGGTAPNGGGNGGSAGNNPNGSAPGGGGAGAAPASSSGGTSASPAGQGAVGQVGFSWSGGSSSPVANDIIRFCLHVNSAGAADGATLLEAFTYGTVATLKLKYHTGGHLELFGYDLSNNQLFDSGSIAFTADGTPLYMDIELTTNGSNVTWLLQGIKPGAGSVVASATGSVSGQVGFVSQIIVDPDGTVTDNATSIGQITVQTYAQDSLITLSSIVNGFAGETAAARISRLCAAQGIGFTLTGNAGDTPLMGPQQNDTFLNVLQSCADLDKGQLFETRDSFGVGYRTRVNMQGQAPDLIADYSLAQLAGSLQPVADDQFTRNYVTVTRNGGASAVTQLTSGIMSTQTPPNGVGLYSYSTTVQANSDSQLANLATWILTIGTVSEYRYPTVMFDMARFEVENQFALIAGLNIGDFLQVANPPVFLQLNPIDQLCWGFTETLSNYIWTISVNTVPESPYGELNPPTW